MNDVAAILLNRWGMVEAVAYNLKKYAGRFAGTKLSRREYAADKVASWQQDNTPLTSKCYKVEGRQATSEVQSNEVIQAKQALNTQSTTTTDCACKCSINVVLH